MTWLDDKGKEERTLSFDELWERSRRLARKMRGDRGVETGDRVLLCYLPGLAFVEAFWSCLRLRCVAVPTYPRSLEAPNWAQKIRSRESPAARRFVSDGESFGLHAQGAILDAPMAARLGHGRVRIET